MYHALPLPNGIAKEAAFELSVAKVESTGNVFKSSNNPLNTNAPPIPGPLVPQFTVILVEEKAISHLVEAASEEAIILLSTKL